MTAPVCGRCARPTGDNAAVCTACVMRSGGPRDQLREVPALVDELSAARYRHTRYGSGGVGGWQEPWDERVDQAEAAATNSLTTIARDIADIRGWAVPLRYGPIQGPPCTWVDDGCRHRSCHAALRRRQEHPAAAAARWLLGQLQWLRHHLHALRTLEEIEDAVATLRRAVDRPKDGTFLGLCQADVPDQDDPEQLHTCGQGIYAAPGARTARCGSCGTAIDAEQRRTEMLDLAADQLAHAEWAAQSLTSLGQRVTASQIRGLAHRGRIAAHGVDEADRPVYRIGDIRIAIDLIHAERDLKAARARRRHAQRSTVGGAA